MRFYTLFRWSRGVPAVVVNANFPRTKKIYTRVDGRDGCPEKSHDCSDGDGDGDGVRSGAV